MWCRVKSIKLYNTSKWSDDIHYVKEIPLWKEIWLIRICVQNIVQIKYLILITDKIPLVTWPICQYGEE